jgi:quinohemoprotein ethanol dehydrogenase
MTRRTSLRAVALLLILVGWSTAQLTIEAQKNPVPGQVTAARIIAAGAAGKESSETGESNNWLAHGRTFDEQRFSPLSQINASNVGQLALAWHYKLDVDRGTEATPLVVDGVMYTTGAFSIVYAIDARTGRLLWKYDPQVPHDWAVRACCDAVNRGVAIWEGKIYLGTLDGYLVALDAATGRVAWRVDTLIDRARAYTITGAPRIAAGRIVIGNGGGEYGVRGYVTAYEAKTGRQAWRFFTVPGDPSKPFESKAHEMAAKTWTGDKWWVYGGGGTVWDSMVYDPDLNLLYIGVGNGSPWNRKYRSPGGGDNLFLSSIVALRAGTGEYVWHYQTTPGDSWDYTATQHLILADLQIDGRTRKTILQAPKNGFFYVLDRTNGELLSAEKYVQVTWAERVDLKTGRPVETGTGDYSQEPKLIWPSPYGGHNWQPMAYHPGTGFVYIPAIEMPTLMTSDPNFRFRSLPSWNNGMLFTGVPEDRPTIQGLLQLTGGKLIAWDPVKGREVWRVDQEHPFNGGVLTTAGNLVFQGTADGKLIAYSADQGKRLWEAKAQTGVIAPPITYAIGGEQYVTVMGGWGGAFGLVGGELAKATGVRSISRVLTFKIGGKATLPPLPPEAALPELITLTASAETVEKGRALYHQNCAVCHGAGAVGGGVLPDLRRMDRKKHAKFERFALGGVPGKGMPSFAGVLSQDEVRAIQSYIIKRARDERDELSGKKK